ncbi:MAG: 7-carboxy-7-deazaguanine synthase QueE [Microcystaceae cyanobacterium]
METLMQTTYPIAETFHSLQGEGAWAGTNAFFIRLAGCEVHCPWCDQKETWNARRFPQHEVTDLTQLVSQANPAIVVITGGEPLQHDLTALTQSLKERGFRLHLETSGAYPLSGVFDWITLSPKPFKAPHPSLYEKAQELKVIIADPSDFIWAESQSAKVPPQTLRYLQPEWNCADSQTWIIHYILRHPQWRFSLQTHKYLGVQ